MKIILLGPPGAGKGTQAKEMAKQLKLTHISTGDLLRQNAASGTQLGKEAQGFMNKGALVPDELVIKMLLDRIGKSDVKDGFILDGFPRTINQAEVLDKMLQAQKISIDLALYLDSSEKVIIQRLSGRLVCSKCGANFHITNMPPKAGMTCDNCRGKLYQRDDDKEETIRKRLEVYHNESASVVQYYESQHKLVRINADLDAHVVLDKIIQLVQARR